MNYIRHLTAFFDRAAKDRLLNPTHISLYMSIFQLWNLNRFKNPISLSRSELMGLSKVSSKTTYHKCMRELQIAGYLKYDPSYHPLRGSWVHLYEFNDKDDSHQSKNCPSSGLVLDRSWTGDGQVLYRSSPRSQFSKGFQPPLNKYKHIKLSKLSFCKTLEIPGQGKKENGEEMDTLDFKLLDTCRKPMEETSSLLSNIAKEQSRIPAENFPRDLDVVIQFFSTSGYDMKQAPQFYHYYQALGWKIGGKAVIQNWHAAASSWVLNAKNIDIHGKSHKAAVREGRLHTRTDKNYSEPL